jgi:hypothetical protein
MKKLLSLTLLIGVSMLSFKAGAQSYNEDVVYLKNGSVIRGVVIEQIPGESLRIETRDGNIFAYSMSDVQKLTRETSQPGTIKKSGSSSRFNKPRGYFGLFETGTGSWGYDEISQSVTIINGYRVLPQFAIGGGIGFETWIDSEELAMPVFLHLRSDFLNRKVSPFVALNIGTYIPLDTYLTGVMSELQAGVSFNIASRFRMTIGLSYATCERTGVLYYYNHSFKAVDYSIDAVKLKAGFSF